MSLWITTQIECDGCDERSDPYVCMTSVATMERARLSKTGWVVSVGKYLGWAVSPGKTDEGIQRLDFCPECAKKRRAKR